MFWAKHIPFEALLPFFFLYQEGAKQNGGTETERKRHARTDAGAAAGLRGRLAQGKPPPEHALRRSRRRRDQLEHHNPATNERNGTDERNGTARTGTGDAAHTVLKRATGAAESAMPGLRRWT